MSEKNGGISRSKIRRDKLFLIKFILRGKKKIKMKYKKRISEEYEEKLCWNRWQKMNSMNKNNKLIMQKIKNN